MKRRRTDFSEATLVGVASTYYTDKDDPRFELALENSENWRDKNLPYVVVDGSPSDENGRNWVREAQRSRGAIVIPSHINGVATQRKQGVAYAVENGATKVVGHESEKVRMVDFAHEIAASLDTHAILVIGRTALAEASLPSTQRRTEHMAGWILEETHGLPADTLSGGRGFNVDGAKELARYPAEKTGMNNWIYLYTTAIEARKKGLSVGGLKVDLLHPKAMVEQEEGDSVFDRKRFDQFKLQLDYLLERDDVSNLPVAQAVLSAMEGLSERSSNDEFEFELDRLQERLKVYGYDPS